MSLIKTELEAEWKKYRLAIIGASCLFFWWLAWLGQAGSNEASNNICRWFGWILGATALVMEIILVETKATVITHWVDKQFKFLVDVIIMFVFFGISVLWINKEWTGQVHHHTVYQGMILWILAGHLFSRSDN